MSFPPFFAEVEPIVLRDGLAEFLGAAAGGLIEYHYADVVKLAGHSCPTVAGSFLLAQRALAALYPSELPARGNIRVSLRKAQDDGTTGVTAAVLGMITGAAGSGGFKGIAGRFERRDLLTFSATNLSGEVCFERMDRTQVVMASLHLEHVPADPRTGLLLQRLLAGDDDPLIADEFAALWQARVRSLLIDHANDPELISLS